jgi:hypothetical protein
MSPKEATNAPDSLCGDPVRVQLERDSYLDRLGGRWPLAGGHAKSFSHCGSGTFETESPP